MAFLRVAVPLPVHGTFTYSSPQALAPGVAVRVPFGARLVNGWVVEEVETPEVATVRPVAEVLDPAPAFTPAQLAFYRWIAEYYLAPLGEVIATATPSGARVSTRRVYRATAAGVEAIAVDPPDGEPGTVLRELVAHPGVTRTSLDRRLHGEVADVARALRALVDQGLAAGEDRVVEGPRDTETWVEAVPEADLAALSTRAVKVREALARLAEGPTRAAELDGPAVSRLVKLGLARRFERARKTTTVDRAPSVPPPLNDEQRAAVAAVDGPGTWLLHGVTGAGKTEVYLALAARALGEGRQTLVLVPEISLTPQLTDRFEARFPGRVAVLHSALTPAERLREWRRIQAGEAEVTVGARSALFAPFDRLGLVVVDEENDDSYKQDEGVRYHARDLAVVRGRLAGCPVVLGSATPSLESWENARARRYHLLQLTRRATPRAVPTLEIVDMRIEPRVDGHEPLLAAAVAGAVREALDQGGKAILLYNRRGFATFVECPGCGQAYECPSCGIAMVYHQAARRLDCHYCGFHRSFQPDCPKCGTTLEVYGKGTERVEEAVARAFPDAPVARMDADTTGERGAHARILDDFRSGRTRLLVGTQIVAKGHDFPDVHVAAVLGADHVLGMPDFRSAERVFSLVTQLIGRAGRGDTPGRVFLQTHHPDHPVFATIGDMDAFAATEEKVRRALRYPPFARLVLLRVEGVDRTETVRAAAELARELRDAAHRFPGVDVLGPAKAPLPRLVGRWRFQVVLRGREVRAFRAFLAEQHTRWRVPQGIRLVVDVDPRSLT